MELTEERKTPKTKEELEKELAEGRRHAARDVSQLLYGFLKRKQSLDAPELFVEFGQHLGYIAIVWDYFDQAMAESVWRIYNGIQKHVKCRLRDVAKSKELAELVEEWAPKNPGDQWRNIREADGFENMRRKTLPAKEKKGLEEES